MRVFPCECWIDIIWCVTVCVCLLQGDKSCSGSEAGCRDSNHISQADWEYRPHLLRFFHRVWDSGSPGKHRVFCVRPLLADNKYQYFK